MDKLIEKSAWQALKRHHQIVKNVPLIEHFNKDFLRVNSFSQETCGLYFDYSKNHITTQTIKLLIQLAEQCQLSNAIDALFQGEMVNCSEQRAALHTALRAGPNQTIKIADINIVPVVHAVLSRIAVLTDSLQQKRFRGFSEETITDVVHLGIGGSHLGPELVVNALQTSNDMRCHFISDHERPAIFRLLQQLKPEKTVVIIASKSFTTREILAHAKIVKNWLINAAGSLAKAQKQMIAVTANKQLALQFDILSENIYPIWDWVGGRYSIWSAVGITVAIMIGMERFQRMLNGACAMDQHFRSTNFMANMPVLLALLGIWYNNFFQSPTRAIIPYSERLRLLTPYLQQLHMESLGKQVTQSGASIEYPTGPIIWGGSGISCQHSFFQLLMQGKHLVPVDFIVPKYYENSQELNAELMANCFAQSETLMKGTALPHGKVASQQFIVGNCPSNTIILSELNPYTLGALLALYEHKVYTQSVIWQINAFDQWGVEKGKQLAKTILQQLNNDSIELPFTQVREATKV